MREFLLDILVCVSCRGKLTLSTGQHKDGEIESGKLICACGKVYPIRNGIPRFVDSDGYVSNFSFEWNRFFSTQLDSFNKTGISAERFNEITGLSTEQLRGKTIIEIGCGMGRFLEVAAKADAQVIGIDLSFSVEAARANLKGLSNVHLIQADIFNLPLAYGKFDLAYSIGVLHHTPNPKKAFLNTVSLLRHNGTIAVWLSPKSKFPYLPKATFIARLLTPKIRHHVLLKMVKKFVPFVLPLVRIQFLGRFLKGWVIPICDYEGKIPLNQTQLLEWSVLDTFDLLSPKYLYPCSASEAKEWCLEGKLSDIIITAPPHTVRAKRNKLENYGS